MQHASNFKLEACCTADQDSKNQQEVISQLCVIESSWSGDDQGMKSLVIDQSSFCFSISIVSCRSKI